MKSYKEIDTKFFNLHFSVPGKDGKYKPEGLFYCAYEDDYENRLVHLAIDSRKGNLLVDECMDKEEAIERLMIWEQEETKKITKISQEFFNKHFIKPDKDGKYRPLGLFYLWTFSSYFDQPVHVVINNRDGNPQVVECIKEEDAEECLEEWMNEVET